MSTEPQTATEARARALTRGLSAVTFRELVFEDKDWSRTEPSDGCISYKVQASFPRKVQLVRSDGTSVELRINDGDTIHVCGNVAHIPTPEE